MLLCTSPPTPAVRDNAGLLFPRDPLPST